MSVKDLPCSGRPIFVTTDDNPDVVVQGFLYRHLQRMQKKLKLRPQRHTLFEDLYEDNPNRHTNFVIGI